MRASFKMIRIVIDPELQDLIPGFLHSRRHDIQSLRYAMACGDFNTVRALGHRMQGDGGGYGFHMISEIGAALEKAAADRNVENTKAQVEALTNYLARIQVVYE